MTLAVSGSKLFAGTNSGVFLSTNNGADWLQINNGLTETYIGSLIASGTDLFAGTSGGVFVSTNNGTNWTQVNDGLENSSVHSLAVSNTDLFAGISGGVWKIPLSKTITSVKNNYNDLPTEFTISQNYPNPFNPSTRIDYNLPTDEKVVIKVYNILGKEIAELVNEQQAAGRYSVQFDGSSLSSGVYFYSISAGKYHQTRKIILLK